jgi:translation elongation factor EF-Ts
MREKFIDKARCEEFRAAHGPISLMDARLALTEAHGDFGKALEIHRERLKRRLVNLNPTTPTKNENENT